MECKKIDRISVLKNERKHPPRKNKSKLRKLFWVSIFDPRMPSQRKIISRNYHIFASDPNFAKLFPRKNLVSGCRRQPNLLDLASPTVPRRAAPPSPGPAPPTPGPPLPWGSWHCAKFRNGGRCEACRHMTETETVDSFHFGTKIKIRGHLRHDYAPPGKIRWFIYQIVDNPCHLIYTGSSQLPAKRFLSHKSTWVERRIHFPSTSWITWTPQRRSCSLQVTHVGPNVCVQCASSSNNWKTISF